MSPLSPNDYDRYLRALTTLHAAPEQHNQELRTIASSYNRSLGFAQKSLDDAAGSYAEGNTAISRHLRNATSFLAELNESPRIPPRIKPSIVPPSATGEEVRKALAELQEATIVLGRAVKEATAQRHPAPPEPARPRHPAPQQAKKRPNRFIIGGAILTALLVVVITLIVLHP